MTYSDAIKLRLRYLMDQRGITVNWLAVGLDMTVSELLDFPEMDETQFDDE